MTIAITRLSSQLVAPASFLLEVDGARILLDCGIYDTSPSQTTSSSSQSDVSVYLSKLAALAPTLDLVVLSHPLLSSVGLLPWLKARCGLRCPVYATLPTREMGRYAVQEFVEQKSAEERNRAREAPRTSAKKRTAAEGGAAQQGARWAKKGKMIAAREGEGMEVDGEENGQQQAVVKAEGQDEDEEVDVWASVWQLRMSQVRDAFLSVNAVRWTQPVHLTGALKGYTLVAHRSGHTLGGSIYTLRPSLSSSLSPASSSSSLLYAPVFNHIKEHHLDSAALLNGARIDEGMRRMGVVVVGAERSLMINAKRVDRERAFLDTITSTLDNGGSVLIPTDPSARLLELLVLLSSHWNFAQLGNKHPLCLVSRTGKDVVGFVQSLTEWMGGQVGGEHGGVDGEKLLRFLNLRIYSTPEELEADIPAEVPKLVLATPLTLSHGGSLDLFAKFATNPRNVLLLPGKGEPGSLARQLWTTWNEAQAQGAAWGEGKVGASVKMEESVEVELKRKVYLAGAELEAYEEAEKRREEEDAKRQAALDRTRRNMHADDDSSDSDSDAEDEEGAGPTTPDEDDLASALVPRRVGGFTGGAGAWDEFVDSPTGVSAKSQSFDMYVKGSFAQRGSGLQDKLPRYRMFPVVERKRRVDAYGEAIDVQGWLRRGVEEDPFGPEKLKAAAGAVLDKRTREEEEDALIAEDPPHKYTVEKVMVSCACALMVVDMEGQTDGRSLKTILPQINPRKLVIVNADKDAAEDLKQTLEAVQGMTQDVFAPEVDERLTVAEETKNFSVRLGDSVMATLRMSRVEDYDVAYVAGVIQEDAESDIPLLERPLGLTAAPALLAPSATTTKAIAGGADGEQSADQPAAEPAIEMVASTLDGTLTRVLPPLVPSLFIGELRLTLLQDKLSALNIPAEFVGEGILVCGPPKDIAGSESVGGKVAVRKVGRGRLVLEGSPGECFERVRGVVYSLHAFAN